MPPSDSPTRKESAARIRAVRNYAGITQHELADRVGLSLATIKRMESGTRPISTDELLQVGEACDFPAPFMVYGIAAITTAFIDGGTPPACASRFRDMETRLAAVEARLRRLDAEA